MNLNLRSTATAITLDANNATFANNLTLTSSSNLIFGTTYLGETTSPTDSGAYVVGANDEFTYSSSSNVQGVLNDLDNEINNIIIGASGLWTDAGAITYLTSLTDDLAIGGSGSEAPFFFDEGNGQLVLNTTGSSAGLVLGDDTLLYDGGTNLLRTPDSLTVDGNIGIGTTNPLFNLDVTGTARFTGNLDAEAGLDVTGASFTIGGVYSWNTIGQILAATNETLNGIDISEAHISRCCFFIF